MDFRLSDWKTSHTVQVRRNISKSIHHAEHWKPSRLCAQSIAVHWWPLLARKHHWTCEAGSAQTVLSQVTSTGLIFHWHPGHILQRSRWLCWHTACHLNVVHKLQRERDRSASPASHSSLHTLSAVSSGCCPHRKHHQVQEHKATQQLSATNCKLKNKIWTLITAALNPRQCLV